MSRIGIIRAGAVEQAMTGTSRQYLAGTLDLPQELHHLHDGQVEVGLTAYRTATAEGPHVHPRTREYQYVLSGRAQILDIDTGEVHDVQAGDFYVIDPGVAHVQKSLAGTRVLFFKHPSGNDKTPVEVEAGIQRWLEELDF